MPLFLSFKKKRQKEEKSILLYRFVGLDKR
jgi:hypothetical protein